MCLNLVQRSHLVFLSRLLWGSGIKIETGRKTNYFCLVFISKQRKLGSCCDRIFGVMADFDVLQAFICTVVFDLGQNRWHGDNLISQCDALLKKDGQGHDLLSCPW